MGLFGTKSASLVWNSSGECFGVLMEKDGHKYKVIKHWNEKASSSDAIASSISKGYASLGVAENDFVIVGEMGMKCSFADFDQPVMNPKDMQKSLSFSLSSHFPMDPVDLHWCYRVVGDKKESGQSQIRLLALKNKIWNEWLDHIGALKVDQIMAPTAVCDAVIDSPVYIPFNPEKGFILYRNEDGYLQSQAVLEENLEDGVFGGGNEPLRHENLVLGPLENLDSETQQKFSQAILLALYGLTPSFTKEKETAFETPKSLIPKRNVVTKTLCGALAIFLLMLGIFQGSRYMAFKRKEAAIIDSKIKKLKDEIRIQTVDTKLLEDLTALHEEMTGKVEKPTSAKDILVVLTETLPDDFYITNFTLRSDRISCKVMVSNPDRDWEDLYDIFKREAFFDNDVQLSKGTKDISLTLKVAEQIDNTKEENN
ncbi:MAG: hypothetical protein NE327_14775 [Lentisphaeraceae bacterium]|nr:hypothetical protein [Lentisphaeraceae bacterium]